MGYVEGVQYGVCRLCTSSMGYIGGIECIGCMGGAGVCIGGAAQGVHIVCNRWGAYARFRHCWIYRMVGSIK